MAEDCASVTHIGCHAVVPLEGGRSLPYVRPFGVTILASKKRADKANTKHMVRLAEKKDKTGMNTHQSERCGEFRRYVEEV